MNFLAMGNVSKIYGEGPTKVQALYDIDVTVDAGALVALMGASGSGKSTPFAIAGSLEQPTSGEVPAGGATGACSFLVHVMGPAAWSDLILAFLTLNVLASGIVDATGRHGSGLHVHAITGIPFPAFPWYVDSSVALLQ